jgi:hypothetical protein
VYSDREIAALLAAGTYQELHPSDEEEVGVEARAQAALAVGEPTMPSRGAARL